MLSMSVPGCPMHPNSLNESFWPVTLVNSADETSKRPNLFIPFLGSAWEMSGHLTLSACYQRHSKEISIFWTAWISEPTLPLGTHFQDTFLSMLCFLISIFRKPMAVLTGNGEEFWSYPAENFLKRMNIQHLHTTPYHSQTNGQLEKYNNTCV